MSEYCIYPNQCGIGADCSECMCAEITRLRAKLAQSQAKEQELLSHKMREGVRTRRAITEAKKKWLAEVEGQEPVGHVERDIGCGTYELHAYREVDEFTKLYTHPAPAKVPDKLKNAIEHYKWCMENEVCSSIRYESKIKYDTLCYVEAMLKSQGGE